MSDLKLYEAVRGIWRASMNSVIKRKIEYAEMSKEQRKFSKQIKKVKSETLREIYTDGTVSYDNIGLRGVFHALSTNIKSRKFTCCLL